MIRLLICDDQAIARQGLEMILSTADDIRVIGTAQDGQDAVTQALHLQPDVVLMDLKMPNVSGVQATRMLREEAPDLRILVLTTYADDEWLYEAIQAGANGYLLKDTPPEQLIAAIRGTADGKTHVDPDVAGKVFAQITHQQPLVSPEPLTEPLTKRELEVLRLVASGFTNAEIARQVHLTEGTVGNYMSNILGKLQANDRTQAVVIGIRHGLLDLQEL